MTVHRQRTLESGGVFGGVLADRRKRIQIRLRSASPRAMHGNISHNGAR